MIFRITQKCVWGMWFDTSSLILIFYIFPQRRQRQTRANPQAKRGMLFITSRESFEVWELNVCWCFVRRLKKICDVNRKLKILISSLDRTNNIITWNFVWGYEVRQTKHAFMVEARHIVINNNSWHFARHQRNGTNGKRERNNILREECCLSRFVDGLSGSDK